MDLRDLPNGFSGAERIAERRRRIEKELDTNLSLTHLDDDQVGQADEKNCEQMFGAVPVPVGYAGPLKVHFSSGDERMIHLPLATTEGALIASVNRGCKALMETGVLTLATHHGTNRSLAFATEKPENFARDLQEKFTTWKALAEATSSHLKVLTYDIDTESEHVFLTIFCDTDEAMGMNMVTLAAQAIGEWVTKEFSDVDFVTVAGNVDSDKKPSIRTAERGRGFEVGARATLDRATLKSVLKTTPEAMLKVAKAKLEVGSKIAGGLGRNLHVANVVAALSIATGQDPAHVVEASHAWTRVEMESGHLKMIVRLPALMVGVRGGGTALPAQNQCLKMLLGESTGLEPKAQLAEIFAAAVLAGELSLLAAQASGDLAKAHGRLGR